MDDPNSQQPPPLYYTQTSNWAIISLIAGILGWIGFVGIGPIVAIITGYMAKNEITRSDGHVTGAGMATAGLILGYINLGVSLIGLCLVLLFFVLGIGAPLICIPFMNGIQ